MVSPETEVASPHQNLMKTLEKAAATAFKETQTDTGQSAPETKVEVKQAEPIVEKPVAETKVETPVKEEVKKAETKKSEKKPKFWESKEKVSEGTPKVETTDWSAKLKETEATYAKRIAELESKLNSESYKRFEEVSEGGNIDDLLADIANTNPNKKSFDQLLKDRTVRSLAKMYGEDKITDELIEEQLELVKSKDAVTLDEMVESEKRFQMENYNSKVDKFKSPKTKEAESFAKDLETYHKEIVGKEIHGLPVAQDRHKRMENLIESYSKGEKQLKGQDLYDALFFLEHKGEIFDNVLETYGTASIDEAVAQVKGTEIRVGNTITGEMGIAKTQAETDYEAMRAKIGQTAKLMEQKAAEGKR